MRFFIDTANIEEIKEANGKGIVESNKLFDDYTGSQIADGYKSVAN